MGLLPVSYGLPPSLSACTASGSDCVDMGVPEVIKPSAPPDVSPSTASSEVLNSTDSDRVEDNKDI
jgi:hypothetical protein